MGDLSMTAATTTAWRPAPFLTATDHGPMEQKGPVRAGLGLFHYGLTEGDRRSVWSLTHLGSGIGMGHIVGDLAEVCALADELIAAYDWQWRGAAEFHRRLPDTKKVIIAWMRRHVGICGFAPSARRYSSAEWAAAITEVIHARH